MLDAPATPAATPATPADPAARTPAEPGKEGEAAPPGAPEEYAAFVAPEGVKFDDDTLGELKALAKEDNLSQDKAQKYADLGVKAVQKFQTRMQEQVTQAQQQWVTDSKADKEFGGDKLNENLAVAKKARDAFGTPELTQLLNETGLGNHPEMIRAFFRIGQAVSEDRLVPGGTQPAKNGQSIAQRMYPNMNP